MKKLMAGSAGVLWALLLCGCHTTQRPRSFEYTVVSQHGIFDGAKMLNEYGRGGWQVVSFNERESGTPNQHYTVILMREK